MTDTVKNIMAIVATLFAMLALIVIVGPAAAEYESGIGFSTEVFGAWINN